MPVINKKEIFPGLEQTYYSLTGQYNPQALRIKNFLSGQIDGADKTGSFSLSPFGGLNFETNNNLSFDIDPRAKTAGINTGNFSLAGSWGQDPTVQVGFNFGGVSQPQYFSESPTSPPYVKSQPLVVPGIYAGPHVDKLANEGARALTGNKVEPIRIDPNQKFLEEMVGQYRAQGRL